MKVTVFDTEELYGERGKFRVLAFADEAVQGAMDLNQPSRIVLEYPQAIIHLMEMNNPDFEDLFIIGHGIGTIAGHFKQKRCRTAELSQEVVELSEKWFGAETGHVIIGDGRAVLEQENPSSQDYIVLDAFNERGTPTHLLSLEFFHLAQEKLTSEGTILLNVTGKPNNDPWLQAVFTTLSQVFPYTRGFVLPSSDQTAACNLVLVGSNVPIRWQQRHMAGFEPTQLEQGYIIRD
ncbi:spermidine synthase [Paenibacillus koleovorans]|uniref:spermidine synthase n=1 Tax=Paenibacillus koleovorans TaxID=121608 RepID=UPI000FDB2478|nr:fused MFS/spermidine synthase [Paenibacillus koleovorans]